MFRIKNNTGGGGQGIKYMCGNMKTLRCSLQNKNNCYNDSILHIFIINKVIIFQARDLINLLALYRVVVLHFGIKQRNLIDSVTKKGHFELYLLFKYEQ